MVSRVNLVWFDRKWFRFFKNPRVSDLGCRRFLFDFVFGFGFKREIALGFVLGKFWLERNCQNLGRVLSGWSFWWKLNRVLGFHCVWVVAPDVLDGHRWCSCWNGEIAFELWEEEREISLSNKLFLCCAKFKYLWWPPMMASFACKPLGLSRPLPYVVDFRSTMGSHVEPPTVTSMCMLPSSFRSSASSILGSGMKSIYVDSPTWFDQLTHVGGLIHWAFAASWTFLLLTPVLFLDICLFVGSYGPWSLLLAVLFLFYTPYFI